MRKRIKALLWLPFILFFSYLIIGGDAAPPCGQFVQYDNYDGKIINIVTLVVPKEGALRGFGTKIVFAYQNPLQSYEKVPKLSFTKEEEYLLKDIAAGQPIKYYVQFRSEEIPKIGRILLDDRVICENPIIIEEAIYQKAVRKVFEIKSKIHLKTIAAAEQALIDVSYSMSSYSDETCGNTKSLVGLIQGAFDRKSQGRWPWVAAMYVQQKYACTANMISRSRAVTAASCFQNVIKPNDIVLYIFSNRSITVHDYKKHPNFQNTADYNIAIIDTESIHERNFVPVCLTDNVVSVVGILGSILTWASENVEENGDFLGTELSVVEKDACNTGQQKTPQDSFCVRQNDDQAWLCGGDSGGGFMTVNKKRWFLRGVASTGLADINEHCDGYDTYIFTDVAKFVSFVTGNINGSSNIKHVTSSEYDELEEDDELIEYDEDGNSESISDYSSSNCGKIHNVEGFLSNAEKAVESRWPWIAAMFVNHTYSCTTNFISASRAVTAAHCFIEVKRVNDIVLLIFNGSYIGVTSYKKHPNYKREPFYDIAILDTDTIFDQRFVPICLTEASNTIFGVRGNVLSYTLDPKINDVNLLKAKFFTVQKSYCQSVFQKLPKHSLCVNHGNNGTWLCKGDSGAGFITLSSTNSDDNNVQVILRGIVSTGKYDYIHRDCTAAEYVIFTDVSKFFSFVTSEIE